MPMEIAQQNENQIQLTQFYDSLDDNTANYLKAKEYEIVQIGNSYLTKMGKIFKEVQDELSNNKNGTFGKWIEALGSNRMQVDRMINRYNYIVTNCYDISEVEAFESLPKSLSYEIAKKSAPPELVQQVLDGEITNHKDYMTEKAKIKAEYEAELAEKERIIREKEDIERLQLNRINNLNGHILEIKNAKDKAYAYVAEKDKIISKLKSEVKTEIVHEDSPELQKAYYEAQQKVDELSQNMANAQMQIADLKALEGKKAEIEGIYSKIDKLKEEQNKHYKNLDSLDKVYQFITRTKEFIKGEMLHIPTLTLPPNNNSDVFLSDIMMICDTLDNFTFALRNQFINKSKRA